MPELAAGQFGDFFFELHGYQPFPWQQALAERVCAGSWPEVIDLPTSTGKTACIDIALFALTVRGGQAPRRIFFVVDRRVVVNEAYLRMCGVRDRLMHAKDGLLYEVAQRFRAMARGDGASGHEDDAPLLVSEMRGGAFRDEIWVRNPLQPAVITSTVDQVGSRLLFRGYGVSPNSWPLHAGLIGNDAIIFLDEAHCSRAFAQTLKRVEAYRSGRWATKPLSLPFHFVEMTATPSQDPAADNKVGLSDRDLDEENLKKRLQAEKAARLIEIKGRKNETDKLVDALVAEALALAAGGNAKRVALFANRIKTAKQICERLRERTKGTESNVELVIGSMRPVDREDLERRLSDGLRSGKRRSPSDPLTFVVSTQCLEVGADLDFDVLVTECAAIDALLQRFGRLDRVGEFGRAQGAIVIGSWQIDSKQPDPVYGEALSKTWTWLKQMADGHDRVNMGIQSRAGNPPTIKESFDGLDKRPKQELYLPAEDAAILLPTHVDMLAQTSPPPEPDPLIEVFLHGPRRSATDVQVVWRRDIEGASDKEVIEIVKLCPPSSREAMPVSVTTFRKWFAGGKDVLAQESDLETGVDLDIAERAPDFHVIAWQGEDDSSPISNPNQIKPGQTLIVKASAGGWDQLGFIPPSVPIDVADRAAFLVRKGITLRLHPEVIKEWPGGPGMPSRQDLMDCITKKDTEQDDVKALLDSYYAELAAERQTSWPWEFLNAVRDLRQLQLSPYPGAGTAYVLRARRGGSKHSYGTQVLLEDHVAHVASSAASMASSIDKGLKEALVRSAHLHDWGKVDLRYQAWLRGGDHMAARYSRKPIAKSGNDVMLRQEAVGLPKDFRHELLSLLFAEKSSEAEGEMRDLILHLVAAHHGRCRPFTPVIPDDQAESVSYNGIAVCKEERVKNAPHRLDRGVSDRFWRLTAAYGWWGLAYLEALLRLADWRASSEEAAEVSNE